MKTEQKIKGIDIQGGMTILVQEVYNEYCPFQKRNINQVITPKKNKKTEEIDVINAKIVKSWDTGNGRAFTQSQIMLTTKQYGEVFIYSTYNFILA
jgi:hypothetical protein